MRTILLAVACVAVATAALAAPEGTPVVKWTTKLDAAQSAAEKSGKPVMLVLVTNRPVVCASGPAPDPFKDPKVIASSAKFECVRLDADKNPAVTEKYRKFDFPVALFLTAKGDLAYETMANLSAEAFLVKLNAALDAIKALPERQALEAARKADTATADDLARLGHLLLLAGRDPEALTVLTEALADLPADAEVRPQVEVDKLFASATKGAQARTALVEWIAANGDHPRRWEGEHRLALAQQRANARESAVQTHTEVAQGSPDSGWGVLSKHYAKAIADQIESEKNPPVG